MPTPDRDARDLTDYPEDATVTLTVAELEAILDDAWPDGDDTIDSEMQAGFHHGRCAAVEQMDRLLTERATIDE